MTETTWQSLANCATTDPDIFLPVKGESAAPAKRICAACDVRQQCLAYALENREQGVWGGTTTSERAGLVNTELAEARKLRDNNWTTKDIAHRFDKSERTIRRWLERSEAA